MLEFAAEWERDISRRIPDSRAGRDRDVPPLERGIVFDLIWLRGDEHFLFEDVLP